MPPGPKTDPSKFTPLGVKLHAAAEARGISLREAARLCTLETVHFHRICLGKRKPGLPTLQLISIGLGLDLNELVSLAVLSA